VAYTREKVPDVMSFCKKRDSIVVKIDWTVYGGAITTAKKGH